MTKDITPKVTKRNVKGRRRVMTDSGDMEEPIGKLELTGWIIGGLLSLFSVLMLIAFVSYIFTGQYDQSLLPNEHARNWLGHFGVWLSKSIMDTTFGLASILIPILMIVTTLRLLAIGHIRLWKWFINCALLMVWFSIAGALIQTYLFEDTFINIGGGHGQTALEYLKQSIGTVGVMIGLLVTAVAYVLYLSGETIHLIRHMLEAARRRAERSGSDYDKDGELTLSQEEGDYHQDENTRPQVIDLDEVDEQGQAKTATTVTFTDMPGEEPQATPEGDVPFEVTGPEKARCQQLPTCRWKCTRESKRRKPTSMRPVLWNPTTPSSTSATINTPP